MAWGLFCFYFSTSGAALEGTAPFLRDKQSKNFCESDTKFVVGVDVADFEIAVL